MCEQKFSFLLGKYPGTGLLGHIDTSTLQETAKLFSTVAVHLGSPSVLQECSGGSTPSAALGIARSFTFCLYLCLSSTCAAGSHCGLNVYFLMNDGAQHLFYACFPSVSLFLKCLLLIFEVGLFVCLLLSFQSSLCIWDTSPLADM